MWKTEPVSRQQIHVGPKSRRQEKIYSASHLRENLTGVGTNIGLKTTLNVGAGRTEIHNGRSPSFLTPF